MLFAKMPSFKKDGEGYMPDKKEESICEQAYKFAQEHSQRVADKNNPFFSSRLEYRETQMRFLFMACQVENMQTQKNQQQGHKEFDEYSSPSKSF